MQTKLQQFKPFAHIYGMSGGAPCWPVRPFSRFKHKLFTVIPCATPCEKKKKKKKNTQNKTTSFDGRTIKNEQLKATSNEQREKEKRKREEENCHLTL